MNTAKLPELSQPSSLPSPTKGLAKLVASFSDRNMDYQSLAEILEKYPAIAAKLISIANSSWSSPVNKIVSLKDACSRLGFNLVKNISITTAISAPFNPAKCAAFSYRTFLTSALLCADAANLLSSSSRSGICQTTRTGGLLHNIGLLWLAHAMPEKTNKSILRADNTEDLSLSDSLNIEIGAGYREAGLLLAQYWNLPEAVMNITYGKPEKCDGSSEDYQRCLIFLSKNITTSVMAGEAFQAEKYDDAVIAIDDIEKAFIHIESILVETQKLSASLV